MTRPILIDIPERIETPRLILRIPQAGDGGPLHKAILDGYEDLVKWLCWSQLPPSVKETEEQCRIHHAKFILREDLRFLIIEKETNTTIGRCAYPFSLINWSIPHFGLSYFITKSYRGKGYAKEAINALTRVAFHTLNARKVFMQVDPENIASLKVPQALNFQLEAKQKGCWPRPDKEDLAELWTFAMFDPKELPKLDVKW